MYRCVPSPELKLRPLRCQHPVVRQTNSQVLPDVQGLKKSLGRPLATISREHHDTNHNARPSVYRCG
jgi:hypothetical protein